MRRPAAASALDRHPTIMKRDLDPRMTAPCFYGMPAHQTTSADHYAEIPGARSGHLAVTPRDPTVFDFHCRPLYPWGILAAQQVTSRPDGRIHSIPPLFETKITQCELVEDQ